MGFKGIQFMFKLESPLSFNHIQFKSPTCIYRKTLLLRSFIHLYKWGVHLILYLDPKPDPFFNLTLDPGTTQILCWIRIQMDQIYKDRFGFRTSMVLPWIGPVCIPFFSDNIFFFKIQNQNTLNSSCSTSHQKIGHNSLNRFGNTRTWARWKAKSITHPMNPIVCYLDVVLSTKFGHRLEA